MITEVEIADGWEHLHWKQQVNIAKGIAAEMGKTLDEPVSGAAARSVIQGELRRRADRERELARSVAEPTIAPGVATLPIRLLRDTWNGEERVRADGDVIDWPIEDAKRLLAAKVAERADPLPG